jgi:hypothetical protein
MSLGQNGQKNSKRHERPQRGMQYIVNGFSGYPQPICDFSPLVAPRNELFYKVFFGFSALGLVRKMCPFHEFDLSFQLINAWLIYAQQYG